MTTPERCPECGNIDLSFGPYDERRDLMNCNAERCMYHWLVIKPHPWDAKLAAIDAECNRNETIRRGPLSRFLLSAAELGVSLT